MARLSSSTRSRDRSWHSRSLPWAIVTQATTVLRDHWRSISPDDRARLTELLRRSGGRPMHLTPQQRTEMSRIIARSDFPVPAVHAPVVSRRSPARRVSALRRV